MSIFIFEFVTRDGKPASTAETLGYLVKDYFDCDVDDATPEELATAYKGPDSDGIGVRWDVVDLGPPR